jgi:outer membrane protein OmpA-like peptidoglycan-associated protein
MSLDNEPKDPNDPLNPRNGARRLDPLRPGTPPRGQRPLSDLDFAGRDDIDSTRAARPDPLRDEQPKAETPESAAMRRTARPDPLRDTPPMPRADAVDASVPRRAARPDPLRPGGAAPPPAAKSFGAAPADDALEGLKPPSETAVVDGLTGQSGLATRSEEQRFSLHKRFSKQVWTGIVISQLALAFVGVYAVRAYFRSIPAAKPAVATPKSQPAAAVTIAPTILAAAATPSRAPATALPAATDGPAAPTAIPAAPTAGAIPPGFVASPAPDAPAGSANPLFGPNYRAGDGKPVYVCATGPDASSLTLQQMQMNGHDIANGFHLGIVPLHWKPDYALGTRDVAERLTSNAWQCYFGPLDENAELNMGVVTAIVDENAGGHALWSSDKLTSYEALAGKRLGMVDASTSAYFARYVLGIMSPEQRQSVQVRSYDSMDKALAAFNAGEIDAVSLPKSFLRFNKVVNASAVVSSRELRVVVNSVLTSRDAIARTPDVVDRFHRAYFAALREQHENPGNAARTIASWGHGAWTGVDAANPIAGFNAGMRDFAQATAAQNETLARDSAPVISLLGNARKLWLDALAADGVPVPDTLPDVASLVDLQWAARAVNNDAVRTAAVPLNSSFSLQSVAASDQVVAKTTAVPLSLSTDVSDTVAVLPCRKFTFLPDSAELTAESRRVLDLCVTPALKQREGLVLVVRGSAAWPGPKGTYTEAQIRDIATSRANAIVSYLASQSISASRFRVESVLPPVARRDTDDPDLQAEDRFVEMALVSTGR